MPYYTKINPNYPKTPKYSNNSLDLPKVLDLPKHILYIHIPKTGGSSFENYLNTKYKQSLFGSQIYNIFTINEYKDITLQHQFYNTIYKYKDILNVN